MKALLVKILRCLMLILVIVLTGLGCYIYEKTLAALWIPVGVGIAVSYTHLTLPTIEP